MSVKLSGYVFRRIHGRIIPIRKGVQLASEAVNKLADEAHAIMSAMKTKDVPKSLLLGKGSDFNVFGKFSLHDQVLKLQRAVKGTQNKSFLKAFPETKDKVALSKAVSDNLPNYGIQTVQTEVVRFKRGTTGLIQPKVNTGTIEAFKKENVNAIGYYNRQFSEATRLEKASGLNLDLHQRNISTKAEIIDTGLNLSRSSIKKVKYNQTAHDILGTKEAGYYATKITDVKPSSVTDVALVNGTSSKALKQMNKLLKEGKMFARVADNEYKFAYRKTKLINKK